MPWQVSFILTAACQSQYMTITIPFQENASDSGKHDILLSSKTVQSNLELDGPDGNVSCIIEYNCDHCMKQEYQILHKVSDRYCDSKLAK